jgi:hypothetical protein
LSTKKNSNFYILGLARSRTTWLASFLSGQRSFCYHDICREVTSVEEIQDKLQKPGFDYVGLADTGIIDIDEWAPNGPVVIVHRDLFEATNSLHKTFHIPLDLIKEINSRQLKKLINIEGLHIPYKDLDEERTIKEIWTYLMPDNPWDSDRYALWRTMKIEIIPNEYLASVVSGALSERLA